MRNSIMVILGLLLVIDHVSDHLLVSGFIDGMEKPEIKNLPLDEYRTLAYFLFGFLLVDICVIVLLFSSRK